MHHQQGIWVCQFKQLEHSAISKLLNCATNKCRKKKTKTIRKGLKIKKKSKR